MGWWGASRARSGSSQASPTRTPMPSRHVLRLADPMPRSAPVETPPGLRLIYAAPGSPALYVRTVGTSTGSPFMSSTPRSKLSLRMKSLLLVSKKNLMLRSGAAASRSIHTSGAIAEPNANPHAEERILRPTALKPSRGPHAELVEVEVRGLNRVAPSSFDKLRMRSLLLVPTRKAGENSGLPYFRSHPSILRDAA